MNGYKDKWMTWSSNPLPVQRRSRLSFLPFPTMNLSYRFPILKLPLSPCAVLPGKHHYGLCTLHSSPGSITFFSTALSQDSFVADDNEMTTAFTTYSGIPYPQSLPLIDYQVKATMLGLDKNASDDMKNLGLMYVFFFTSKRLNISDALSHDLKEQPAYHALRGCL